MKIYLDYSEDVLKLIRERNIPLISILHEALEEKNIEVYFGKEETNEQSKDIKDVITIKSALAIGVILTCISQAITNLQINGSNLECVLIHPDTREVIRDAEGNPIVINQNIENVVKLPGSITFQLIRSCDKSN